MSVKESNIEFGPGTLYIEGKPIAGIESFECDVHEVCEEHRNEIFKFTQKDAITFTVTMNKLAFCKLTGLYDWVCNNCPNRRVVHLIKYGKNRRVRWKNFRRALRIIGRELDRSGNRC